jgi:hypothetical protein
VNRVQTQRRPAAPGTAFAACAAAALIVAAACAAPDEGPAVRAANTNAVAAWTRAQRQQAGSNRWVAAGVVADRSAQRVVFAAEATGLAVGATVEFLLVEPASDRDYESLAVALAETPDIDRALAYLGLPSGVPVRPGAFRFWPKGERVSMRVAPFRGGAAEPVGRWVTDRDGDGSFGDSLVYVGSCGTPRPAVGARDAANAAPGAVATTYNEPTALLDVPVQALQGDVYGNRLAGPRVFGKGDLLLVTLQPESRPSGRPRVIDVALAVQPAPGDGMSGLAGLQLVTQSTDPSLPLMTNDVRGAFERFAALAQGGRDPFVTVTLDDRVTVSAARDLAHALTAIEGVSGIRLDAPPPSQLFYKAFLPQEQWRVRKDRLTQPWELRLARKADGWSRVLVEIREDWSKANQLDPDLTVVEHPFATWDELPARIRSLGGGPNALLVFAPADAPLSAFMPGVRAVHETQPVVFVFTE